MRCISNQILQAVALIAKLCLASAAVAQVAEKCTTGPPTDATQAWADNMDAGNRLQSNAQYSDGLRCYRAALVAASSATSPNQLAIAAAHDGLGVALLGLQKFADAEWHFRRSLELFRAGGGRELASAKVMLNLGMLYSRLRRFVEAEEMVQQATAIQEKVLGPNDPEVAAALNNRSVILVETSRCREAIPLLERARGIWSSSFGSDHLYSGQALHNLGVARVCMGDYAEALPLLTQALEVREKVLPAGHPDIAETLFAYAGLQQKLGNRKIANAYRKRALAIHSGYAFANQIGLTVDVQSIPDRRVK